MGGSAAHHPGVPIPNEARYLSDRATRGLIRIAQRQPRIAALEDAEIFPSFAAWLLPLAAFLAGVLLDRLGDPHKLDLLSPPLLGFIAWNLCVYIAVIVAPFWPRRRADGVPMLARFAALPSRIGGRWGMAALVRARFHLEWLRIAGRFESLRVQQVLHASAAAWAIGTALSIALGGVVREYRVGWESLWLGADGVHTLLSWLFAPVQALLPLDGFTLDELRQLHSAWGVALGPEHARKWVKLYLGLLAVVVVLPRIVLAAWAAWKRRGLAGRFTLDASAPYFAAALHRGRIAASIACAVPILADALARAARESEPRDKSQDAAMRQVLLRVDAILFDAMQELRRLHGADHVPREAAASSQAAEPHVLAELLEAPKAGFAGAAAGMAAGALAGAKVDLLTGGLTMGAGAALGALIGGTGAFGAAKWFSGSEVRLSDEQLDVLMQRVAGDCARLLGGAAGAAGNVAEGAKEVSPTIWERVRKAQAASEAAMLLHGPVRSALVHALTPR